MATLTTGCVCLRAVNSSTTEPYFLLILFPCYTVWSFHTPAEAHTKISIYEVTHTMIMCSQETTLKTVRPCRPSISSWTPVLTSTLNSSTCYWNRTSCRCGKMHRRGGRVKGETSSSNDRDLPSWQCRDLNMGSVVVAALRVCLRMKLVHYGSLYCITHFLCWCKIEMFYYFEQQGYLYRFYIFLKVKKKNQTLIQFRNYFV